MSLDRKSSGDSSKGILTASVLTLVVFSVWATPLEAQGTDGIVITEDDWDSFIELGKEPGEPLREPRPEVKTESLAGSAPYGQRSKVSQPTSSSVGSTPQTSFPGAAGGGPPTN